MFFKCVKLGAEMKKLGLIIRDIVFISLRTRKKKKKLRKKEDEKRMTIIFSINLSPACYKSVSIFQALELKVNNIVWMLELCD